MATVEPPVESLVAQLFQNLGIRRAHVGACTLRDVAGLVSTRLNAIASLTFLGARALNPSQLAGLDGRLLFIHGDRGPNAQAVPRVLPLLTEASECILEGYEDIGWGNAAESHGEVIAAAMESHLRQCEASEGATILDLPDTDGWLGDLWYQVRGHGPALVLFPVELSASQWEPIIPRLALQFTTITLGGERVGAAANLFQRAQSPWYQGMLRNLFTTAEPQLGERLLEVGCGSGVVLRWLARETAGRNPLTGIDLNSYLLREARAGAEKEGLLDLIDLHEGSAEALPLDEASFDVTFCITVLEEGDADAMLAELVRVTRPGGRVACMVRAADIPWWVPLPLDERVRAKVQWAGRSMVDEHGCADKSLGPRMTAAGLEHVTMSPQFATATPGLMTESLVDRMQTMLEADEKSDWDAAVAQARTDGTLMLANTFYSAVGTKPLD